MHFAAADYILDIAENAVEACPALVEIDIEESAEGLSVAIADDGRGMTAEELRLAFDPFHTDGTKHERRVGLGLPFLAQGVEQAGGRLVIETERGRGTRVAFTFPSAALDAPPVGDLPSLFLSLACLPGDHDMTIRRRRRAPAAPLDYDVVRSEVAEALEGLERADSLALLRDYLRSQEEDGE